MRFFADDNYHFQFLRTLGHTYGRSADIGECLETATQVISGDDASWYRAWKATADRVFAIAERCAAAGHRVSAGEAYLRASNYYRTAGFYHHAGVDDADTLATARASRECFLKALPFIPLHVEAVEIPYERTSLPGYVLRSGPNGRRATVICHTGFDGTAEEIAMGYGFAAAWRRYTCVVFDGPGQGRVIREQHLPFRPDWDRVVGPVLDYALARPDVDPARVVLTGISFGGNLAPRAAAREHRLAALVANGGVYSFYDPIVARMPIDPLTSDPAEVEALLCAAMPASTPLRFFMRQAPMVFGMSRIADVLRAIKEYDVTEAANIRCPTLIIDTENEALVPGQARPLYERLTCPKTFMFFNAAEGAGTHCQIGAEGVSAQRIFDWLDDVFAGNAVPAEA